MRRGRTPTFVLAIAIGAAVLLSGCDESPTQPEDRIIAGVNITKLFAEPTQAEIDAVAAEWLERDVEARNIEEVAAAAVTIGTVSATLRVVSHTVGGVKHYGAILVPQGAAPGSLPIIMYGHGGDGGIDIDQTLDLLPFFLGDDIGSSIFVAPAFRSEPLAFDGTTYRSEGPPSPWDRDVDDALALLNVVVATTPEADPDRIGVIGFSRGAGVALLMAERDPNIDVVVEFFGPTDFYGPFVQEVFEEALLGTPRDLPGLDFLNAEYIEPLKLGELTIAEARRELLRRSSVYYADRLPQLQIHHGTADQTVPVGEAERLIEVMVGLGRTSPDFEAYLYEGGEHNPLTMTGSIPRARNFLSRLISSTLVALRSSPSR